jgi:hypothetical protein
MGDPQSKPVCTLKVADVTVVDVVIEAGWCVFALLALPKDNYAHEIRHVMVRNTTGHTLCLRGNSWDDNYPVLRVSNSTFSHAGAIYSFINVPWHVIVENSLFHETVVSLAHLSELRSVQFRNTNVTLTNSTLNLAQFASTNVISSGTIMSSQCVLAEDTVWNQSGGNLTFDRGDARSSTSFVLKDVRFYVTNSILGAAMLFSANASFDMTTINPTNYPFLQVSDASRVVINNTFVLANGVPSSGKSTIGCSGGSNFLLFGANNSGWWDGSPCSLANCVFSGNVPNCIFSMFPLWGWILIGICTCVIVVGIIVLIVCCCRRKKATIQYVSLGSSLDSDFETESKTVGVSE